MAEAIEDYDDEARWKVLDKSALAIVEVLDREYYQEKRWNVVSVHDSIELPKSIVGQLGFSKTRTITIELEEQ